MRYKCLYVLIAEQRFYKLQLWLPCLNSSYESRFWNVRKKYNYIPVDRNCKIWYDINGMGDFKSKIMTLQLHIIKRTSHRNVMSVPRATCVMTFSQDMCTKWRFGQVSNLTKKRVMWTLKKDVITNPNMSAGMKKC